MAIVTPIPIPSGPSVPNSNDPETTFDEQFEASLTWQRDELAPKANALAEATFDNATDAQASATAAAASATTAHNAEVAAMSSTNFKGDWAGLSGSLTPPASVAHLGRTWNLLEPIANVTTEQPGVSSKWRAYDVVMPIKHMTLPGDFPNSIDSIAVAANSHAVLNKGLTAFASLPGSPQLGDYVVITVLNGRADNVIVRNGALIENLAENVVLDDGNKTYSLRYISDGTTSSWRFI